MDSETAGFSVFISYAHKDNESPEPSRRWLDRLLEHLKPLVQQGQVSTWSDREIQTGEAWHDRIQAALQSARAAVLLVSPSFLASDYVRNNELPLLLEKARGGGLIVIPIFLRPSVYDATTFKFPDPLRGSESFTLASFQAANSPDEPLNNMTEPQQDRVLVSVAKRLLGIVNGTDRPRSSDGAPAERDPPSPATPVPDLGAGTGHQRSRSVRNALEALVELMKEPEVQDAVVQFRTHFEAAAQQIEVLKVYKDVHDQLHALQFQCYEPILAELDRFPGDEVGRGNLEIHEQTLFSTLASIRRGSNAGQFQTALMLRGLEDAGKELHSALEEGDPNRLKRAASLLGRVLNVYPAQVNTRLNETAKSLRLPSLVRAMTVIRDRLLTLELDPDKVAQFVEGVSGLSSLEGELSRLLDEHDRWQYVSGELHLIQSGAGQLLEDLQAAWPQLQDVTRPLHEGSAEEWAASFRADSERLEDAVASQNPARARDRFRRYRRSAGLRFFEVDVNLKRLCSQLLTVAEPLVAVLRVLK